MDATHGKKRLSPFDSADGPKQKKPAVGNQGTTSQEANLQVAGALDANDALIEGNLDPDVQALKMEWWRTPVNEMDGLQFERSLVHVDDRSQAVTESPVGQIMMIPQYVSPSSPDMTPPRVRSSEFREHEHESERYGELLLPDDTPISTASSRCPTAEHDTCFGVVLIEVEATTSTKTKLGDTLYDVRVSGDIVKLYHMDEFAGLLISESLGSLVEAFPVHLTATLAKETTRIERGSKAGTRRTGQKTTETDKLMARLLIYGFKSDTDGIGKHLSDAGLYLQHPSIAEYDGRTEYFNPHLLLRPGAPMPRIEDLTLDSDADTSAGTVTLNEVSKNRLWRMFNAADGHAVVPDVKASRRLACDLQDHQLAALQMMVERECGMVTEAKFPTLWERFGCDDNPRYRHIIFGRQELNPAPLFGGILADEMGLGKTLSPLALICWHLDSIAAYQVEMPESRQTTIIVVPKSILPGWKQQITSHIKTGQVRWTTYYGPSRHQELAGLLQYDIVLTTYDVLRHDFTLRRDRETVYSLQWHRVILDEAHRIRTRSSAIHRAALSISSLAKTRWCLSGTPIQNSLDDFGALLSFLHVSGLHEMKDFDRLIALPYRENDCFSARRLQDLIRATCLRRTMAQIGRSLGLRPPVETTTHIELSDNDRELYLFFQRKCHLLARDAVEKKGKKKSTGSKIGKGEDNLLTLINFLRLICNYGERMLPSKAVTAWRKKNPAAVNWQMLRRAKGRCSKCDGPVGFDEETLTLPCGHDLCPSCLLDAEEENKEDEEATSTQICRVCHHSSASSGTRESRYRSAKTEALIRNLREEQRTGPGGVSSKSIVFSCWTRMLNLVELDLDAEGFTTSRIDGTLSLDRRQQALRDFTENPNCRVLLASINSAGEGIDITAANHVHILEPQWNPMTEYQAIGRVQRPGQDKEVTVTRYIVNRSIETYIQWIQSDKLRLINQSMDQTTISQEDLDQQRWKKLGECLALYDATHSSKER